ncbi:MAG: eight-cysteine-cluster domain-containing protein [Candidatus Micrarchaeota archaeon]
MKLLALLIISSLLLFGCTQPQPPSPSPTASPTIVATVSPLPTNNPDDIPPFPDNEYSECVTASDCAIGGCNGEVCTTAENAQRIGSICVYKPEYACYKQISCGCIEGACAWQETPEFRLCVQGARQAGGSDLPPLPQ